MMGYFKTRKKSIIGFTVVLAAVFSILLAGCKASTSPSKPDDEEKKQEEETKQFTVTFVLNDGSENAETIIKVDEGKAVASPENPVRTGFSFGGWFKDEELSESYDFTSLITSDLKLYAKWNILSFSVTFQTDGGTEIEAQTVEYNTFASKPKKSPEKENCTFAGWFQDKECTVKFDFNKAITADTVIYAGWNFLGYKITFNTDGGTDVSSQSIMEDEGLVTKPQDPSKVGYDFSGWYSDEACTVPFDFETKIAADTTIYAKWTIKSYTVTFQTDGGTEIEAQTVEYGSKVTEPEEAPEKEHYTFAGWYKDINRRTPYNFDSSVTGEISIYAKWNKVSYKATFISDGQTVAEYTLDYLSEITKPVQPKKTGYTFGGWYADNTFKTEFDFTQLIKDNVTIYAKWIIITYTVKFESNGGSEVASATVDYNTSVTAPANPTKAHYTFAGWYKDSKLRTKYVFTDKITENITLYANWDTESYTVTFNSNGGTEISSSSVVYNSTVKEPAKPEKTGYTFAGWYADSGLTTPFNFTTGITANITLYAKYKINTYTVTFNSNGGSATAVATVEYKSVVAKPADPAKQYYTFGGWYTDTALQLL